MMVETDNIKIRRRKIMVNGMVQGVGFRPFVYRLAKEHRLNGFVNNNSQGVFIEVEGDAKELAAFCNRLREETPPLASIVDCRIENIPPLGEKEFIIRNSRRDSHPATLISPDTGICEDCLHELFDPQNRRYRYPFINCTNCGPRYTIVQRIPYDRPNTSMDIFPLCSDCSREYHDPADRRFHAQPNACHVCGPQATLHDSTGCRIETEDPIAAAINFLRAGNIVALRGIGGFHLTVDARNHQAVQELRRRKGRAEKPFALMAADVDNIRKFCLVSPEEEKLLLQPSRPIVLLPAIADHDLARSVAPSNRYLGFMLPSTPLHYLLMQEQFDALVMTSGNFSEEPIAIGNQEALKRLAPLADYFLLHNREILQRCDDSIIRFTGRQTCCLRRSRGYTPAPVFLARPTQKRILACGGELKNTIALSRGNTVFLSQHIGDLDNPAALSFFENGIEHLQQILEITPEVIAYDLHPEYLSSKWALRQEGIAKIGVQHHHAHLASVMAENGVSDPTIGIILDGTGYGSDGTIWGGEVLIGDAGRFLRHAWLQPFALPGATAAIKQPWRTAMAVLYEIYGKEIASLELPFMQSIRRQDIDMIIRMIERKINSPFTSSCGRLFDAVAAMLGIRSQVNYEAQAAVELEMCANESVEEIYCTAFKNSSGCGALPVAPLICSIVADIQQGEETGIIAAKFHRSLAELFLNSAQTARESYGINRVGLSGGVFQNVLFFNYFLKRLQEQGFEVMTHNEVPANDGGLALGQIAIADAMLEK